MGRLISVATLLLVVSSNVEAGCIGPVIMGECQGKEVQWDTNDHGTDVEQQESDFKLTPRNATLDEIPSPSSPSQSSQEQRLDHFYGGDPQSSPSLEPQEYQGRFR